MTPIDTSSIAQAQLHLGGVLMPGIIEPGGISGWARVTKYKVNAAKGSDGASVELEGDEPAKGKIVLTFYEDEHVVQWADVYTTLRAARAAGSALDILQPYVNAIEVTSVVLESIGQVVPVGPGKWTVELSMLEWIPAPKKAPGKPSGSAANKNGGSSGSPEGNAAGNQTPPGDAASEKTAAEEEFERLAEEAGFL